MSSNLGRQVGRIRRKLNAAAKSLEYLLNDKLPEANADPARVEYLLDKGEIALDDLRYVLSEVNEIHEEVTRN